MKKKDDFLQYYSENIPNKKTVLQRIIKGGDRKVNTIFSLSYLLGFTYGNTIYYLNLNKMANIYNFEEW